MRYPIDHIVFPTPIAPYYGEIYISQFFGQKALDYSQFDLLGHNGLDIAAPLDTPILAASDGFIIEQTSKDTGFGLRISQRFTLAGQEYACVYGHQHKLALDQDFPWDWNSQAHPVTEGQIIGYVDSTGFSTGNHLHFGIYPMDKNGNKLFPNNGYGGAVDPLPILKGHIMSNSKLVKNGQEWGFYMPATTPDGLKSQALNFGYVLPEDSSGNVDFSKLTPDLVVSQT